MALGHQLGQKEYCEVISWGITNQYIGDYHSTFLRGLLFSTRDAETHSSGPHSSPMFTGQVQDDDIYLPSRGPHLRQVSKAGLFFRSASEVLSDVDRYRMI